MSELLVAYDIRDDSRRARVTKTLARLGRRVQFSVFLVSSPSAEAVAAEIAPLIAEKEDDVRIHPLCAGCQGKARLLGVAATTSAERRFRIV